MIRLVGVLTSAVLGFSVFSYIPETIIGRDINGPPTGLWCQPPVQVTDDELARLGDELMLKERNNRLHRYVSANFQGNANGAKGNWTDVAPLPLLTVDPTIWDLPTFSAIRVLYDNYERDTSISEQVTSEERIEEDRFIDAIMNTDIMRYLMNFFVEKGFISSDTSEQRDNLKSLWFDLYPRRKGGNESSSSFEHIFLAEIKKEQKLLGLHNWIYFHLMETANILNYYGYLRNLKLNNEHSVLKFTSRFGDIVKPVSSMFVGTSPEFDMAIYTLCLLARKGKSCRLYFDNVKVPIRVYLQNYTGKTYFASAYPDI